MRPSAAIASLTVTLMLLAPPARADDEGAIANALFNEGQALMKKKDYPAACAKFEGSLRIAQKVGTQFNLADCYERLGRTAAAWEGFQRVVAMTKDDPRRNKAARDRVGALDGRLTRLVIHVDARVDGMEVRRQGLLIPPEAYGVAFPVDPATYTIEATAPGFKPWSGSVKAQGEGRRAEITVPKLEPAPKPVDPPPDLPPIAAPERGGSGRKTVGLILGGAGVAALGTSMVFGLLARSAWNDVEDLCPDDRCLGQVAFDKAQSAHRKGTISTVTFLAGTALLATGVVLYLTAPTKGRERTALRVAPSGVGIVVGGGF